MHSLWNLGNMLVSNGRQVRFGREGAMFASYAYDYQQAYCQHVITV